LGPFVKMFEIVAAEINTEDIHEDGLDLGDIVHYFQGEHEDLNLNRSTDVEEFVGELPYILMISIIFIVRRAPLISLLMLSLMWM
jgi:hypothetical protein